MNDNKKEPQQRTEDPKKQNAQQEREYRKQKDGTLEKLNKQPTDEKAIKEYEKIKEQKKQKKN